MPNPAEQYLENLAPLLARLVGAVHDEGHDAILGALVACRALPAPPDVDPDTAIPVVLAAMIDPSRRVHDLLAWTAQLIGVDQLTEPAANPLAVEMALAGHLPAHALSPAELAAVIDALADRGWPENEIRHHLPDADPTTIRRHLNRTQSRNARARRRIAS